MFTAYTYEDWVAAPEDKRDLIKQIIEAYKASDDFTTALTAQAYFDTDNTEIRKKYVVQLGAFERKEAVADPSTGEPLVDPDTGEPVFETKMVKNETKVAGTRLSSGIFQRLVIQQNQHLLGNGVTLKNAQDKKRLGLGFDTALAAIGEKALVDGVCWGLWNKDHIETIRAATDPCSGAVALLSEEDAKPRVLIQFWRLNSKKPLHVRVFETTGVTTYKGDNTGGLHPASTQQPYLRTIQRDAGGVYAVDASGYAMLPVVPLYANPEHRSELTVAIKSKIDCFDRISSDFGDNLQMANDVYWVLNNFGGNAKEVLATLAQIQELKAVVNISDGTGGGSTAEPHAFEVPYAARSTALEILRRELYRDYMGLDTETISGGSLTNVAIRAASKDLNLKCDRYEWEVFAFVQSIMRLIGIDTEDISFTRQSLENETETIENIYRAAEDLDRETRLRKNPMVMQEEIPEILRNKQAEEASGIATMKQLQAEIDSTATEGEMEDA